MEWIDSLIACITNYKWFAVWIGAILCNTFLSISISILIFVVQLDRRTQGTYHLFISLRNMNILIATLSVLYLEFFPWETTTAIKMECDHSTSSIDQSWEIIFISCWIGISFACSSREITWAPCMPIFTVHFIFSHLCSGSTSAQTRVTGCRWHGPVNMQQRHFQFDENREKMSISSFQLKRH